MLRAIFAAMANAMRAAFWWCTGFVLSLATAPFRILGGQARSTPAALDLAAIKKRFEANHLTPKEIVQSHMRDSQIAYSWIVCCTLDNAARPFPSAMSKTMQGWLCGLSYRQLMLLRNAGGAGIFDHVTGKRLLDGVPRHRALQPITLVFPAAAPSKDSTAPRLVRC
jgi:hypothetical protein